MYENGMPVLCGRMCSGGKFFSAICGDFFNGMDYGSACILGMGMFLCVVIITCTGIVVSRLEQNGVPADKKER